MEPNSIPTDVNGDQIRPPHLSTAMTLWQTQAATTTSSASAPSAFRVSKPATPEPMPGRIGGIKKSWRA